MKVLYLMLQLTVNVGISRNVGSILGQYQNNIEVVSIKKFNDANNQYGKII